jgi:hypothetical protein
MKKANPDAKTPQEKEAPDSDVQELARVVPIRTETTLTRYPVHRIAKRGEVSIKDTKKNGRGKVETTWEVQHPPGPLAYKLDTLIINRRVDELRPNIPKLIKLGSLKEICRELGLGGNTAKAKEALYENVGAIIRTKLEFTGNDGTQRDFEFGASRYSVIFTGERLPGGKRADAVYILLNDLFWSLLKHSKTRPLDYEYLKKLSPAAQRLYELLSFAMFGTLTHGRPNAQMLYSEFCKSAPLTRYHEWNRVRPQMWKIHKPHIEAGYIKSVEFQETTDDTGAMDWLMKYTPGRRARQEFREFTTKKLVEREPQKPRLVTPPKDKTPPLAAKEESDLVGKLREEFGIAADRARAIEENELHQANAHQWLAAKTYVHEWKTKGSGFWIEAITKPYELPPAFLSAKTKIQEVQHALKKQAEKEAREQHEEKYRGDYWLNYLQPEAERLRETNIEAHNVLQRKLSVWDDYKERPDLELMQAVTIENFVEEHSSLGIFTFWQWDAEQNAQPFSWQG